MQASTATSKRILGEDDDDEDFVEPATFPLQPPSKKQKTDKKGKPRYYEEVGAAKKHRKEMDRALSELQREVELRPFTKKEITLMTTDEKLGHILFKMSKL